MALQELDKIAWWAYGLGFFYALFIGQLLIPMVTELMYDLVDPEFKGKFKHKWQPYIVGLIERSLYILSLLGGHAAFIALWVGLKVGIPYFRWTDPAADKDEIAKGRTLFMNSLYGNALSILYSVVGYLIILWLDKCDIKRAVIVALILSGFNVALWMGLKIYQNRMSRKQPVIEKT
jgi:hypothetical protein